jgi:chromate reductase
MRVLGISGSLRHGSHNTSLLRAAAAALPPGVELERYDELAALPPFNQDDEATPPASVLRLREAIGAADAVLIATPEYNASVPGVLKNAIDWASRPYAENVWRDKPVAVIGASTGVFGAVWAQADVRKSVRHAGAHVLDEELPVGGASEAFDTRGRLRDPELRERLTGIVRGLVREAAAPVEVAA